VDVSAFQAWKTEAEDVEVAGMIDYCSSGSVVVAEITK